MTAEVERDLRRRPAVGEAVGAQERRGKRAVADLIRPYVPRKFVALGTDGFGRSDTRAALRALFEVDAKSIVLAALAALDERLAADARHRYGIDAVARPPWER